MTTRYQKNQKTILCIMYNFMHDTATTEEFTDELITNFQASKIKFSTISRTIMKKIVKEVVDNTYFWQDEYHEMFYENNQYYLTKHCGKYDSPELEQYSNVVYCFYRWFDEYEFKFRKLTTAMDFIRLLDKLATIHTSYGHNIYGRSIPFYFPQKILEILYNTIDKFINKYPNIAAEKIKTKFYEI